MPERWIVAKKCFLIVVNFLYVGYMTTAILWVLCVSRIPEISQHTFWSFGSGNILSANNFQRLNKGVEREKNRTFFIFTSFSDVPYTNGCFPIMAATKTLSLYLEDLRHLSNLAKT